MSDSENARMVALDVIKAVSTGKKVEKGKIQIANGYSVGSARVSKAIRTQTYKKVMNSFLDKLIAERNRLIEAISRKQIEGVDYDKAVGALDKLVKNTQLLSGGDTERIGGLSSLLNKYNETNNGTVGTTSEPLEEPPA